MIVLSKIRVFFVANSNFSNELVGKKLRKLEKFEQLDIFNLYAIFIYLDFWTKNKLFQGPAPQR